jgi:hypothetical protein
MLFNTRALWIRIAIVAGLFALVLGIWRRLSVKRSQQSALGQVRGRCSSAKEHATILVLMATHGNPYAAARAIHSVFDGASCPFRIFVGLHETVDAPPAVYDDPAAMRQVVAQATPTMAAYASMARSGRYGRSFSDQVRVTQQFVAHSFGTHVARAALMAHAYRGQTFVMTLSDAVELQRGWDEVAIDGLAKCRDPHAMLVAPPAYATSHAARSDAWDVVASTLTTGGNSSSSSSITPRFPVFERFSKAGLPIIGSRAFGRPRSTEDVVPVLFWCGDCSFGPARAYLAHAAYGMDPHVPPLPTPFDATLACLTSGEDGIMSARMWTSGWAFYTLPHTALAVYQDAVARTATVNADKAAVLANQAKADTAKLTHEAARLLLGGTLRKGDAPRILHVLGLGPLATLDEWSAFVGVSVATQLGSGRARMGATPNPTPTEIVSKYDSHASYNAERSVYQ